MVYEPYALVIHVDGSCLKNPGGPSGIAGIAVYPDKAKLDPEIAFQQGFEESTNQRMELHACIEALEWTRANARSFGVSRVVIVSDSQYLCDHHWHAAQWKKNGWFNRDGRPIENIDLWERILFLLPKTGLKVDFKQVKGKKAKLDKKVDQLAKEAARGPGKIKDQGFRGGDISRTRLPGEAPTMFQARGQQVVIRIYRKAPVSQLKTGVCRIIFETISGSGESTEKYFAYSSHEIEDQLHRHSAYRVQFNDNPRNPIIESILEQVSLPPPPNP